MPATAMPRVKMVASRPPEVRLRPYSSRMPVSSGAKTCRSAALIMKVNASRPNETPTTSLGTGPSNGRSFTREGAGLAGTASIGIASIGSGYVGTTCSTSGAAPARPAPVGVMLDIIVSWSNGAVRGAVLGSQDGAGLGTGTAAGRGQLLESEIGSNL